jgi:hypothetical protein
LLLAACRTAPSAPVACAATAARCAEIGDSKDGYQDPYRIFIRIQSDLDRVAAGQPRRTVPVHGDHRPHIVLPDVMLECVNVVAAIGFVARG